MRFSGDDGGFENAPYSDGVWFNVSWSFVEPPPTGLLLGFEVALFKGVSAADTQNYVSPIFKVHPNDRAALVRASIPRGTTPPAVYASVRPLYGFGPGAWVQAAASVTPSPTGTRTASTDNLIPNPTSELGAALAGYGSALVVNDAGNSYAGNYCRKLDSSAANQTNITELIPCIYGDQFSFDCYVKGSSATPVLQLVLTFYNASGTSVGTSTSSVYTGSTSYQKITVKGAVPSGAMTVQASVKASTTAASSFLYFDNLSLRRSVLYTHMDTDSGFRVANAVGNTGISVNDRVYYRGNIDPSQRGGAPNISCLTVTPQVWNFTTHMLQADLKIQPTAANDNLDGMRYAQITLYKQSAAGTTAGLTQIGQPFSVPINDRLFLSSTDSNTGNSSTSSALYIDSNINGGVPAMLVTLYNALGPSDTHCFYSAAGWSAGTPLTDNGTTFPAGFTGGISGGSGGGGGGGGSCITPDTMVDLWDSEACQVFQKAAGQIQVGDMVHTIHPTGTIGCWPVKAASIEQADAIYSVAFDGGLTVRFAKNHRLRIQGKGWVSVQDLEPGDMPEGTAPKAVASVSIGAGGDVVSLTVDEAASYQTSGILSSNMKPLN